MPARAPILPFVLLAALVFAIVLPGNPAGLLLLTPALAILIPLLAGGYPGERSMTRLASWLSRLPRPSLSRPAALVLSAFGPRSRRDGFSLANAGRGPPLLLA